jgi:hypothetical protein
LKNRRPSDEDERRQVTRILDLGRRVLDRGAKDAPKYKDFILALIFAKRPCDVLDDEVNCIAQEVGSRAKAFKLAKHDKKPVRFYAARSVPHPPLCRRVPNGSPKGERR